MQTRGNNSFTAARAVAESLLSYPKEKEVSTHHLRVYWPLARMTSAVL
jgi:hypothetical protein